MTGTLTPLQALTGTLSPEQGMAGSLSAFAAAYFPEYDGPTEFTPSEEEQVIRTADTNVRSDMVVHPIPSNYGLVTWNGSVLTVS